MRYAAITVLSVVAPPHISLAMRLSAVSAMLDRAVVSSAGRKPSVRTPSRTSGMPNPYATLVRQNNGCFLALVHIMRQHRSTRAGRSGSSPRCHQTRQQPPPAREDGRTRPWESIPGYPAPGAGGRPPSMISAVAYGSISPTCAWSSHWTSSVDVLPFPHTTPLALVPLSPLPPPLGEPLPHQAPHGGQGVSGEALNQPVELLAHLVDLVWG